MNSPAGSRRWTPSPYARGSRGSSRPFVFLKALSLGKATCCFRSIRGRSKPKSIASVPNGAARRRLSIAPAPNCSAPSNYAPRTPWLAKSSTVEPHLRERPKRKRQRLTRPLPPPSSTSNSHESPHPSPDGSGAPSSPRATSCRAVPGRLPCSRRSCRSIRFTPISMRTNGSS